MKRPALVLILSLLLLGAGCFDSREPEATVPPGPAVIQDTQPASAVGVSVTAIPVTTISQTHSTPPIAYRTSIPDPTPARISDAALSARIVDARNKLNNFMDSNVADTVIIHPGGSQDCEVKQSKELGYLIDATTGESTFIKGDYWSIDAGLFSNPMRKDHEYIIIHTHPRMWTTCRTTGITSLSTFSIGDLEATANLTEQGYHVKTLIAIADKEYKITPKVRDDWKSAQEIRLAVNRIERRMETPFSYYDTTLNHEFYDVDNLMPLLAKELNYTYMANNDVIA
jgi:hypothetical protein